MSRCFPFPPPGYERKHRPEDLDILKEAKRKEKKHKKDKKDKERKKDKEKKEKDGSDEKSREKKDRKKSKDKKEKHKDRKKEKDKDKGKDKEKSSISEESTVAEELQDHPKAHSKDGTSFSNDSKRSGLLQGENGAKPSHSSLPPEGNDGSKFVQELDRRIRDDEKGSGSQLPERVAVADKKVQEMAARPAAIRNSSGVLANEKVGNENKSADRNIDPQGFGIESSGNKMVHNFTPAAKNKVEGNPRPVDEHNGRRLDVKEKYKETGGNKKGDRKRDRNKESHGKGKDVEKEKKRDHKGKDAEKEKKRDDKGKSKTENKKNDHNKLKDDVRNDPGCDGGNNNTDLLKDTRGYAANEDNRKRKETYTNGFLHESEIRPNKKQKPAHQLIENGRKTELLQTPTKFSHDKQAAVPNIPQALNRNSLTNGTIEAHKPSSSMSNSSSPIMGSGHFAETPKIIHRDSNHLSKVTPLPKLNDSMVHHDSNYLNKAPPPPKMNDSSDSKKACPVKNVEDLIAEASRKPPHPDSKYLAEVLTVPNEVVWCEIDDLDWLLNKKDTSSKPNKESVGVEKDLHVWSEAVHIDSADVCALPYVIPY